MVSIAVQGGELSISSRPDPASQDSANKAGGEEARTLEILEELDRDVDVDNGATRAHA